MTNYEWKPGDLVVVTGEWKVIAVNTSFRWANLHDGHRTICVDYDHLARAPKPEEPTGLGAVVEDSEGRRWVRIPATKDDKHGLVWNCERNNWLHAWRKVDAVRVLAEGVSHEG